MTDLIAQARQELAPKGRLRAALNFGNNFLAKAGDPPSGLTVEISRKLAAALGVEPLFVPYPKAVDVFESVARKEWDICFLANDPIRAAQIAFTRPYVELDGSFMVRAGSELQTSHDVGRAPIRVATGRGSAYSLGLARVKGQALVRDYETGAEAMAAFLAGDADCLAAIGGNLRDYAAQNPGFRVLAPPFVTISQAIGTQKEFRAGAAFLEAWLSDTLASGAMVEMARPFALAEAIPR